MNADRRTTEQASETAVTAPRSASTPEVGVSGASDPLNGPQNGAQPRGPVDWARQQAAERETQQATPLRDQYAAALANCQGSTTWGAMADAVMAVRDREVERMKILIAASESDAHAVRMAAQYADTAIVNGERAERAEAAIERVRGAVDAFCHEPHPSHDHVCPDDVRKVVLAALDQPAHNAGPSIRECAQADRRWWDGEKTGEQP